MAHLGERTFGPGGKTLAELDDEELAAEARRRRAARAQGSPTAEPPTRSEPRASATPKQVRQWYANLELPEGASREEVERAYERLIRRYDPDRHRQHPERHRAALELTRSLTRAYRGLMKRLQP